MSQRRGSRNFRTACEWSLTTISVKACDFGGVAIPFPSTEEPLGMFPAASERTAAPGHPGIQAPR